MDIPILKRQRETPGSILEIDIEGQYYVYAQIVYTLECVFFDFKSTNHITDCTVLKNKPILFAASVLSYIITRGYWPKIGKLPIREEFRVMPNKFIHHRYGKVEFEIYNPNTGSITPSTRKECKNLERAAVWDINHIVDRIRDYYDGIPCIWLLNDYDLFPERKPK